MYSIEFSPAAERQLRKLNIKEQTKLLKRINLLSNNPLPPDVKKLQGLESVYRIRQGNWRILYTINGQQLTIWIMKIGHRKDVYR